MMMVSLCVKAEGLGHADAVAEILGNYEDD
jgi:hypothetical protein